MQNEGQARGVLARVTASVQAPPSLKTGPSLLNTMPRPHGSESEVLFRGFARVKLNLVKGHGQPSFMSLLGPRRG